MASDGKLVLPALVTSDNPPQVSNRRKNSDMCVQLPAITRAAKSDNATTTVHGLASKRTLAPANLMRWSKVKAVLGNTEGSGCTPASVVTEWMTRKRTERPGPRPPVKLLSSGMAAREVDLQARKSPGHRPSFSHPNFQSKPRSNHLKGPLSSYRPGMGHWFTVTRSVARIKQRWMAHRHKKVQVWKKSLNC